MRLESIRLEGKIGFWLLFLMLVSLLAIWVYGGAVSNAVTLHSYVKNVYGVETAWIETLLQFTYDSDTNAFLPESVYSKSGGWAHFLWYYSVRENPPYGDTTRVGASALWEMGTILWKAVGTHGLTLYTTSTKNQLTLKVYQRYTLYTAGGNYPRNWGTTTSVVVPVSLTLRLLVS